MQPLDTQAACHCSLQGESFHEGGGGDWGVWVGGEAVWGRMDMGPQGCEGGGEMGVAGHTYSEIQQA